MNKIYNNLTVRSNVFAVWLTVGLFEVTDDRSRPVKLGAEIGHKDNRQIRHRMFAIIDRTNLNIYSTTATAAVSSTGSQTVALKDVTGTAYGTAWSIQVGDILEFDTGANAEQVQVTAVSAQNKTITATFQTTHSANVPVFRRGNPGPNPRFDPHSDPSLVPYFSLID